MEKQPNGGNNGEVPAFLTWHNSLHRFDGVALAEAARDMFQVLLVEKKDDPEFRARVVAYFEEARAELAAIEGSEELLEAFGTLDEFFPQPE